MQFKSVQAKMQAGFGVVSVLLVGMGLFSLQQESRIERHAAEMRAEAVESASLHGDVTRVLLESQVATLQHLAATDELQLTGIAGRIEELDEEMRRGFVSLGTLRLGSDAGAALHEFEQATTAYVEARWAKTLDASASGDKDWARAFADGEVGTAFAAAMDAANAFGDEVVREADRRSAAAASVASRARFMTLVLMGGGAVLASAVGFVIARGVSRPLGRSVESLGALAHKDLTKRLEVSTSDETARMAESLNAAIENLSTALATIGENSQDLAVAAEELSSVSTQIGSNAEETSAQSTIAAAAGEQVSQSVATVASAVEELMSSVSEIAKSAADAAHVAAQAVELASATNVSISKLDESSVEIGNVVKLITAIAEQTNLLALNATIEAARAGDAGKGFAVVASEVKELANETAKATDEISRRIETIQGDTQEAVGAIGRIAEIIGQIDELQSVIAASVEEQAATTTEIGRHVVEAARGTSEIAENITAVAGAAQSTAEGVGSSQRAVDDLNRMAAELKDLVGEFRY